MEFPIKFILERRKKNNTINCPFIYIFMRDPTEQKQEKKKTDIEINIYSLFWWIK